nr:MAG TPA: hypothetical protein [Caudoviricetes sp.]
MLLVKNFLNCWKAVECQSATKPDRKTGKLND